MTREITPVEIFIFNGKDCDIALASRLGYPEGQAVPLSFVRLLELPILQEGSTEPQNLLLFLDMGGLATYQMSAMVAASIAVRMLEAIFLNARIKICFAGQWLDRLLKVRENMIEFPDGDIDGLPGTPFEGATSAGNEKHDNQQSFVAFQIMMNTVISRYFQERTLTEGEAFYMKYRDTPGGVARNFAEYILDTVRPEQKEAEEEQQVEKEVSVPLFMSMLHVPIFRTLRKHMDSKDFVKFCTLYRTENRQAAMDFAHTIFPGLDCGVWGSKKKEK